MFVRKRDGMMLKADISDDHKRAYHHFGLADVADSGNYACRLMTTKGLSVSGNHQVFGVFLLKIESFNLTTYNDHQVTANFIRFLFRISLFHSENSV